MPDATLTAAELERRIDELKQTLRPLLDERVRLGAELDAARSREWIEANGCTRDQVHHPDDGGRYFHVATDFIRYLETLPARKRFATWNETVYFTDELIARGLPRERMPGRWRDVPEG